MEGPPSKILEKNDNQDFYSSVTKKFITHGTNTTLSLAAIGLEVVRWSKSNYRGAEVFENTVNPHDALFNIMQSMGDVGPGFVVSAIGYQAIDVLSMPLEAAIKKKIPEQAKIAAAVILGIGSILVHEKGNFFSGSVDNGNDKDIIFGMLGPAVFAGTQYLLKDVIRKINTRIMEVKSQETNLDSVK